MDPFLAAEDRLPPGQPPIVTTSVERLHSYLLFQAQTRQITGYSSLGIVTGEAGIGKTIAIQAFLDAQSPVASPQMPRRAPASSVSSATASSASSSPPATADGVSAATPPSSRARNISSTLGQAVIGNEAYGACARIRIAPRATAKAVATDLVHALVGRPFSPSQNTYAMEDAAVAAIRRRQLALLIVDEGDWLTVDSFEVLRHVFDRTGCPMVIVGLPSILQVVRRHEKFSSRVGLWMEFLPLGQQEVLQRVLPQLRIPRWSFDPAKVEDAALGARLWARVAPSLRKLRVVLQYASQLAVASGAPQITEAHVEEIFHATLLLRDP